MADDKGTEYDRQSTTPFPDDSFSSEPIAKALVVVRGPFLGKKVDVPPKGMVIGRADSCDLIVGTASDGTSRRHARLRYVKGSMVVEDLGSTNGLIVNRRPCKWSHLVPGDLLQVGTTLFKVVGDVDELRFHETMYNLVVRDALTGLFNRTHFDSVLKQEISRARRHEQPLSVLLVDLDHFKEINDIHGHVVGDTVLAQLGVLIASFVRAHDIPCRYGGDEFLVLLPKTDLAGAAVLAERCRQQIREMRFEHDETPFMVTVSIGVAELGPESDRPESLILAADEALYTSKHQGRDCVVTAKGGGLGETQPLPQFQQ